MRFLPGLILVFSSCATIRERPLAIECAGDPSAKMGIVYLHGMDVPEKSAQERQNREIITRIAAKLGARVTFPRAEARCPGGGTQICWGWKFDAAELRLLRQKITTAAVACGAPPAFVVVGFSNGGYAVNRLFEECLFEPGQLLVSVAAGNQPYKRITGNEKSIGKCGTLKMLVGKKDHFNNRNTHQYVEDLMGREGQVFLTVFSGGHEIPENALLSAFSSP
jgi:predicted esterase